jgi:hypothetical protein
MGEHKTANTAQSYGVDSNWYADSKVADHVIGDLEKLTIKDTYNGHDQIYAANGTGMHIKNIGHSIIHTPYRDLPCLMFFMFLKPQKVLHLFIILHLIIMFSLNFTLISFSSRIGSRGKFSCKARLKEAFTHFHAAPSLLFVVVKFLVPSRYQPPDAMLI